MHSKCNKTGEDQTAGEICIFTMETWGLWIAHATVLFVYISVSAYPLKPWSGCRVWAVLVHTPHPPFSFLRFYFRGHSGQRAERAHRWRFDLRFNRRNDRVWRTARGPCHSHSVMFGRKIIIVRGWGVRGHPSTVVVSCKHLSVDRGGSIPAQWGVSPKAVSFLVLYMRHLRIPSFPFVSRRSVRPKLCTARHSLYTDESYLQSKIMCVFITDISKILKHAKNTFVIQCVFEQHGFYLHVHGNLFLWASLGSSECRREYDMR